MERADWLKGMRAMNEAVYDLFSPEYWGNFGLYENSTHLEYLQKFLGRIGKSGTILSAACGAGRYDGMLLAAGHSVVGIDQSAGMLARAREHFPQARYEKMGLQEMDFHEQFDGAICMDAMEHVCPEDWPGIMKGFQQALKPGGLLYYTLELPDAEEVEASYARAKAMGLPVIYGELADEVEASLRRVLAQPFSGMTGELADVAVYHYYPSLEQARSWMDQAGLAVEEEGDGSGYHHFIARKRRLST